MIAAGLHGRCAGAIDWTSAAITGTHRCLHVVAVTAVESSHVLRSQKSITEAVAEAVAPHLGPPGQQISPGEFALLSRVATPLLQHAAIATSFCHGITVVCGQKVEHRTNAGYPVMHTVLAAWRLHPHNPVVVLEACRAVRWLCAGTALTSRCEANAKAFCDADGIGLLFATMAAFAASAEITTVCVDVVFAVACSPGYRGKLVSDGCLPRLYAAVAAFPHSFAVSRSVLDALIAVTSGHHRNQLELFHTDGIAVLCSIMQSTASTDLLLLGCRLFATLVSTEGCRNSVIELGCIPVLQRAVALCDRDTALGPFINTSQAIYRILAGYDTV